MKWNKKKDNLTKATCEVFVRRPGKSKWETVLGNASILDPICLSDHATTVRGALITAVASASTALPDGHVLKKELRIAGGTENKLYENKKVMALIRTEKLGLPHKQHAVLQDLERQFEQCAANEGLRKQALKGGVNFGLLFYHGTVMYFLVYFYIAAPGHGTSFSSVFPEDPVDEPSGAAEAAAGTKARETVVLSDTASESESVTDAAAAKRHRDRAPRESRFKPVIPMLIDDDQDMALVGEEEQSHASNDKKDGVDQVGDIGEGLFDFGSLVAASQAAAKRGMGFSSVRFDVPCARCS